MMESIKDGRLLFSFPDMTQMQVEQVREALVNASDKDNIYFFNIKNTFLLSIAFV